MKIIFLITAFSYTLSFLHSDIKLANTKWRSNYSVGDFGDGFKMNFNDSSITISNGLNFYNEYKYYSIKDDTLILSYENWFDRRKLKNKLLNYPVFKIIKCTNDSLTLEALNWRAVFITSVLITPYINTSEKPFIENDKNISVHKDLTDGGGLNIQLEMFK